MGGLSVTDVESGAISVGDGEIELFRYTFAPDTPQLEAPKPYLHPLRTRAGRLVSLLRPHDHVWHKGIAWSLPVVGDENFWGGPTYVRGRGYVQLDNDGTQRHTGVVEAGTDAAGAAVFAHALDWVAQDGRRLFTEQRRLGAMLLDGAAWGLAVDIAMTNVSDAAIPLGSPTTRGRENAGYGGLFWRGPRSFTGGSLVTADAAGKDELRGTRAEWMAFAGRHDEDDAASLVLMLDDARNPQHPPQWFARSEEYAALNPAPFFSDELEVEAGATARFRYGVGVAEGDAADAPALAAVVRTLL